MRREYATCLLAAALFTAHGPGTPMILAQKALAQGSTDVTVQLQDGLRQDDPAQDNNTGDGLTIQGEGEETHTDQTEQVKSDQVEASEGSQLAQTGDDLPDIVPVTAGMVLAGCATLALGTWARREEGSDDHD